MIYAGIDERHTWTKLLSHLNFKICIVYISQTILELHLKSYHTHPSRINLLNNNSFMFHCSIYIF